MIIASACVFNNYIDRGIDVVMARTKRRALVVGKISNSAALWYATILGLVGFTIIIVCTNLLVSLIGLLAFIDYVALYGFFKRRSTYGTLVGSVSGAAPIVAGYVAMTGSLDWAALLLFLILVFWQMAHFYAIALYRAKDYAAAGVPVSPVVHGYVQTRTQTQIYVILFVVANALMTTLHFTGYSYLIVMLLVGCVWLVRSWRPMDQKSAPLWGRQMFLFSLIVMIVLCVMLSVGGRSALLP